THDGGICLRRKRDRNSATPWRVLRGVREQVVEDLMESCRIRFYHDRINRHLHVELLREEKRLRDLDGVGEDRGMVEPVLLHMDLSATHWLRVENIIDDSHHMYGLPIEHPMTAFLFFVRERPCP